MRSPAKSKQLKSILKPTRQPPIINEHTLYNTYHADWTRIHDAVLHLKPAAIATAQHTLHKLQQLNDSSEDDLLEPLITELIDQISTALLATKLSNGKPIQTSQEKKQAKREYDAAAAAATAKPAAKKGVMADSKQNKLAEIKKAVAQHRKRRAARSADSFAYNSDNDADEQPAADEDGGDEENDGEMSNKAVKSASKSKYKHGGSASKVRVSARKAALTVEPEPQIQVRSKRRKINV